MNSKSNIPLTNPQSLIIYSQLQTYIDAIDTGKTLSSEVKQNMARSLTLFVEQSVSKFIKGQAEHGGDLRDRNLAVELAAEQIDSFWYGPFGAMNWATKP